MKQIKSGFGLIEVTLALVIASLIIVPLIRVVMKTVTSITDRSAQLQNQNKMESFLYESRILAHKQMTFTREENISPTHILQYTRTEAHERSMFFGKYLVKETVIITDKVNGKQQSLHTFFAPFPKTKSEEKSVKSKEEMSQ